MRNYVLGVDYNCDHCFYIKSHKYGTPYLSIVKYRCRHICSRTVPLESLSRLLNNSRDFPRNSRFGELQWREGARLNPLLDLPLAAVRNQQNDPTSLHSIGLLAYSRPRYQFFGMYHIVGGLRSFNIHPTGYYSAFASPALHWPGSKIA